MSLRRPRPPFGRQHPATRQRHPSRPPATARLQLDRQKVMAQWNGGRCCWRRQRRLTVEAGWSFLCVATWPQVSHGCQGFKRGAAVVRARAHFFAKGRSSAMWGKGQHRTARAKSRGEERAMLYFACAVILGRSGDRPHHRGASNCHVVSSCLASRCLTARVRFGE